MTHAENDALCSCPNGPGPRHMWGPECPPRTENGPPVEVAAALARVPTCGWHHGQYPDLCWWCGLNRVRVLPPESRHP